MSMTDATLADPKEEAPQAHQEVGGPTGPPASLWDRFRAAMEAHGGAQQYLLKKYPDRDSQKHFANNLLEVFPRPDDVDYYLFKTCPPHQQTVAVHISDLGFGPAATTKPPPYKTTCLLIGEDIIKNTFQTEGGAGNGRVFWVAACAVCLLSPRFLAACAAPASLWPPLWFSLSLAARAATTSTLPDWGLRARMHDAPLPPPPLPGENLLVAPNPDPVTFEDEPFWAIYVKGMARACCALVVADLVLECHNPAKAQPVGESVAARAVPNSLALAASFVVVHIRRGTCAIDRTSVALENARLSAKGAIRKPHDVVTWVGTLSLLLKGNPGLDASGVIKRYNTMATSQTQLAGSKRTACLLLLEKALPETIDRLVAHVSAAGAGAGIFAEEAFSNKRILPGPPPRLAMTDQWAKRSQVTPASFDLMVKYFVAGAARTGVKKLDKSTLEAGAAMAALVLSLRDELRLRTQLPDGGLDKLVAAFVAGDPALEVELQCAVADRSPSWDPLQMPAVAELIREHSATTELRVPDAAETVKIQAGQLAAEEFALLEKKVQHDLLLVRSWTQKVRDRESQLYYQRLHHKEARHSKAEAAAAAFFTPGHRNVRFHSVATDNQPMGKIVAGLSDAIAAISALYRLQDQAEVAPLPPAPPPRPAKRACCGRLRGSFCL